MEQKTVSKSKRTRFVYTMQESYTSMSMERRVRLPFKSRTGSRFFHKRRRSIKDKNEKFLHANSDSKHADVIRRCVLVSPGSQESSSSSRSFWNLHSTRGIIFETEKSRGVVIQVQRSPREKIVGDR